MRRLDRAFDRLASRGRRSDAEDVIDRLERRLAGEPVVVRIPGRPDMERTEKKVTRRRGLLIAAAAMAAALVVGLPLWFLWRGDDSAIIGRETTTTLAATTTSTTTTTTAPTTTVPATTVLTPGVLVSPVPREVAADWASSHSLEAVSASEMWIIVEDRIGRLQDGAWTFHRPAPGAMVRRVAVAPDGTVWTTTSLGAFSFDGVEWIMRSPNYSGSLAVASDGTVWIGTLSPNRDRIGLSRWDGESWTLAEFSTSSCVHSVAEVVISSDGAIWIASGEGLCEHPLERCEGAACETVQVVDFPPGTRAQFEAVALAPNGDVWVGYWTYGPDLSSTSDTFVLARFDGEAWTTYDLPGGGLRELAVGPDGVIWCVTGEALRWFDGTTWSTPLEGVTAVDVAPDGTVWYADDEGVHTITRP